jgi:hypothetical protein
LIFNEGVKGTRKAINFLRDIRDMLSGHSKQHISKTVKWDGAPAVFAGIDPSDGKFFVAKKGVFNKNPKVYKTPEDVKADTSGDLQEKLLIALREFSKLGIKSGVYQGDLMFTKSDLKTEEIDGEKYITFHPNTIVYAVPFNSELGRRIRRAEIGVVWHTTYSGSSFESMSASFGKGIANKLKSTTSVWSTDATYRDETGNATFTADETKEITAILSEVGSLFNRTPAALINAFSENDELLLRMKTFNNTFVRQGQIVNPRNHAKAFMDYIHDTYQKEIDKRKTPAAKKQQEEKRNSLMTIFTRHSSGDFVNLFTLMNRMADAKHMIINKMNQAGSIGTFLKTRDGFKVTAPEGYVAIDHLSNDAVKLVDRMTFSRSNFSSEILKGWQK